MKLLDFFHLIENLSVNKTKINSFNSYNNISFIALVGTVYFCIYVCMRVFIGIRTNTCLFTWDFGKRWKIFYIELFFCNLL